MTTSQPLPSGNKPPYTVTNSKQALRALLKACAHQYSAFLPEPHKITLQGPPAFSIGKETVEPIGNTAGAEQTLLRRYTNIWMQKNGQWQLIARHANNICNN